MPKRLIGSEYDPVTGFTTQYWQHGTKLTIRRLQDVEPMLKHNKAQFNDAPIRHRDGIEKVATIPNALIEKWMRERGFNWFKSTDAERKKILNDPDYRHLRTRGGRL